MRRTRSFIFGTLVLCFFMADPGLLYAQAGSAGLSFLKIGVGARTMGMGDAGVAGSDMGSAMYYNPALIADDADASLTIMHNEWIEDITTEFLGLSVPFGGWSLGIHMGLTSVSGLEVRDVPGPALAETDTRNFAGGLTAAFALAEGVDFGATAKYVFEKIDVEEAGGYAFDFGVAVRPFSEGDLSELRAGVALANLGHMSELRTVSTTLPLLLRYGAAYRIPVEAVKGALNVSAEGLSLLEESTTHVNLGAEFDYLGMVFLRLGYQTGYENKGLTFGAGATYSSLRFDYAFTSFSEVFGNAHTIALSVTL